MSITPLRLALIGLGGMGMTHLEIFAGLPQAQIAAVADSHAPFADRAAAQIPTAAVFYDPLDCVNNADIDAVVVATTDDTHFDITQASIARGLHVLCEKPLTTTAHQSRQVVDAERATGRRLVQVGWMRRFDADYQNLYSALRSGTVGEPVLISQRHRNPLSVIRFDEQELITSSASHDIDIFRWLCGEDIAEVSAISKTSQDGAAVIVVLTLASQSGVLGVMELGRGPGLSYDIGCDIVGSAGALTLTPADRERADDHAAQPHTEAWMQRFAQAYRTQDAEWLTA
ncbi:MAG: myo-inositol 2-dehydrogenase / D-chiro-inositol 1-dehydrogenase, partial [Mycobacterium sp.]|nr:myo-inositol 2-dehydrogenase / D-chiro-inositol 1-dehydrogenase [Mycobacterium sp.]